MKNAVIRTTVNSMKREELVKEISQPKILMGRIGWISN
jgi:hypothetical protein